MIASLAIIDSTTDECGYCSFRNCKTSLKEKSSIIPCKRAQNSIFNESYGNSNISLEADELTWIRFTAISEANHARASSSKEIHNIACSSLDLMQNHHPTGPLS